jgi:hypothetical protein
MSARPTLARATIVRLERNASRVLSLLALPLKTCCYSAPPLPAPGAAAGAESRATVRGRLARGPGQPHGLRTLQLMVEAGQVQRVCAAADLRAGGSRPRPFLVAHGWKRRRTLSSSVASACTGSVAQGVRRSEQARPRCERMPRQPSPQPRPERPSATRCAEAAARAARLCTRPS